MAPDLAHVESWIFDLDNSLYPPSADVFALIDERMGAFIQQLLGCDPVEDFLVRRHDALGLARLEHALAEHRRVRVEPLVVQAPEHGDALVERLAGDETSRAEPHAVPTDERLDAPAVRGREDRLPQRRL